MASASPVRSLHAGRHRIGIELQPVGDRRDHFGGAAVAREADDLRGAEDRLKGAIGARPVAAAGRGIGGPMAISAITRSRVGRSRSRNCQMSKRLRRRGGGGRLGLRRRRGRLLAASSAGVGTHGRPVVEIADHFRIAGQPQRPPDVFAEVGTAGDQAMMLDVGRRDDAEQVERVEHRRTADDRRGDLEDVARQHADDRTRRVRADREALGDRGPHFDGHLRQEMGRQFLVAADLVFVMREVLHEQLGRGAQQRGIARLLVRARNVGEIVGELS